jgi:hypothetical protein
MKHSEEIIKIVKDKSFKTFWHCFDYLVVAGYPVMEAFSISMQEFEESNVFIHVAFIKNQYRNAGIALNPYATERDGQYLRIGIINENNIHLAGLYKTYRDWLAKDSNMFTDIEETCEIIEIDSLNDFLLTYLLDLSKRHYGFEAFKFVKRDNNYARPPRPYANNPYGLETEINQLRALIDRDNQRQHLINPRPDNEFYR